MHDRRPGRELLVGDAQAAVHDLAAHALAAVAASGLDDGWRRRPARALSMSVSGADHASIASTASCSAIAASCAPSTPGLDERTARRRQVDGAAERLDPVDHRALVHQITVDQRYPHPARLGLRRDLVAGLVGADPADVTAGP